MFGPNGCSKTTLGIAESGVGDVGATRLEISRGELCLARARHGAHSRISCMAWVFCFRGNVAKLAFVWGGKGVSSEIFHDGIAPLLAGVINRREHFEKFCWFGAGTCKP